jgi:hypothetical protein
VCRPARGSFSAPRDRLEQEGHDLVGWKLTDGLRGAAADNRRHMIRQNGLCLSHASRRLRYGKNREAKNREAGYAYCFRQNVSFFCGTSARPMSVNTG